MCHILLYVRDGVSRKFSDSRNFDFQIKAGYTGSFNRLYQVARGIVLPHN